MSDRESRLREVHNILVATVRELQRAQNLLMEARTEEQGPAPSPLPKGLTPEQAVSAVKLRLPAQAVPDLEFCLTAAREVKIRPKRWLEDAWGEVNDAVKSMGGVWRASGKESCWLIPFPREAIAPAWEAYEEARVAARKAYEEAEKP